jgi:glutamine amidotransferase PdxT
MVRQGAVVGVSFHPELTPDRRLHRWIFRGLASRA